MLASRLFHVISVRGFTKPVLRPRLAWNGASKYPCLVHKNITLDGFTLAGSQMHSGGNTDGFNHEKDLEFTLEVKLASEDAVAAHPSPGFVLFDCQSAATYCDAQRYRH